MFHVVTAIDYMTTVQDHCTNGGETLSTARKGVDSMVAGTWETTLSNNLEELGGARFPTFNTANEGG